MSIRHDAESIRGTLEERRVAKQELAKSQRKVRELEEVICDLWTELQRTRRTPPVCINHTKYGRTEMTWFARLPDTTKAWAATIGALALAFSGGGTVALTLSGWSSIPGDMVKLDITNARQDSAIASVEVDVEVLRVRQTATDRRGDYTLCLLESLTGTGTRTATRCAIDYGRIDP